MKMVVFVLYINYVNIFSNCFNIGVLFYKYFKEFIKNYYYYYLYL